MSNGGAAARWAGPSGPQPGLEPDGKPVPGPHGKPGLEPAGEPGPEPAGEPGLPGGGPDGEPGRPGGGPDGEPAAALIDVTRLRVAIARLSRSLRRHELAGLTPTQLSALSTVDKAGPLRLGDLAAAEKIAPSTLTRLVTVLEERGYVQRSPVPGDARASTLVVTEQGHAILERIRQETTTLLAGSLSRLSPGELTALAAALPALERIAEAGPAAETAP